MKVKELIEALQEMEQEDEVIIAPIYDTPSKVYKADPFFISYDFKGYVVIE